MTIRNAFAVENKNGIISCTEFKSNDTYLLRIDNLNDGSFIWVHKNDLKELIKCLNKIIGKSNGSNDSTS